MVKRSSKGSSINLAKQKSKKRRKEKGVMSEDKYSEITEKRPSALAGAIIMLCAIAVIMWGALIHGFDVTVLLFIGSGFVCAYGVFVQKIKYNEMEQAAIKSIASAMDALLVIMSIEW